MEILIVKLAALGDVLRTTSLLKPLRRRYPGCRISWLTSPGAKPLLEENPFIQRILVLGRAGKALSRRRFDLVLSLEEDPAAARIARRACRGRLVGVTIKGGKLGYTASSSRYYAMSLLRRDPDGGHKKADALKAANRKSYAGIWLDILGLPKPERASELRPMLALTPGDRKAARKLAGRRGLLSQKGAIGFNPGAGGRWPAKQVSVKRSAEILEALHRRFGRPLILFGGKEESRRNREILGRANAPVIDAGTGHGLREFAGLLDLCSLVIATDSLALHAAAALGKPLIALIGPTSAAELDVFGRGRKLVSAGGCACFYRPRCRFAESCLDRLPISRILNAVGACLR